MALETTVAAMEAQGLAMTNLPHAMQAFRDAANGGDPAPMTQFLMSEESSSEDGVIIRLLQTASSVLMASPAALEHATLASLRLANSQAAAV